MGHAVMAAISSRWSNVRHIGQFLGFPPILRSADDVCKGEYYPSRRAANFHVGRFKTALCLQVPCQRDLHAASGIPKGRQPTGRPSKRQRGRPCRSGIIPCKESHREHGVHGDVTEHRLSVPLCHRVSFVRATAFRTERFDQAPFEILLSHWESAAGR
jgi:hypothetical protein